MDLGFRGEVVELYRRYRRGYPPAVVDALVSAFGLTGDDIVVDVGCGTGQLTLPMAGRVRAVVGVDPEPDMVALARSTAAEHGVTNATWVVGADTDLPALGELINGVGAVTIGQALHWMDHERLFRAVAPMIRPGGGVAVVSNGTRCGCRTPDGRAPCAATWRSGSASASPTRAAPTRRAGDGTGTASPPPGTR